MPPARSILGVMGIQPTRTTVSDQRREASVNGPEWTMIKKHYNHKLIELYRSRRLAALGVPFLSFYESSAAKSFAARNGGQYRTTQVLLTAYRDAAPNANEPWKSTPYNMMFEVDGNDTYLVDRLLDNIARTYVRQSGTSQSPANLDVRLFSATDLNTPLPYVASDASAVLRDLNRTTLFARVLASKPYDIVAIVSEAPGQVARVTSLPALNRIVVLPAEIAAPMNAPKKKTKRVSSGLKDARAATQKYRRPTEKQRVEYRQHTINEELFDGKPIAVQQHVPSIHIESSNMPRQVHLIAEHIADKLHSTASEKLRGTTADKASETAQKLVSDRRFVVNSIEAALHDPALYARKEMGPATTPSGFWKQHGIDNMAHLINAAADSIGQEVSTIDARRLFVRASQMPATESVGIANDMAGSKAKVFSAHKAKGVFAAATIGACIWSRVTLIMQKSPDGASLVADAGLGPRASADMIRPFRYGGLYHSHDPALLPSIYRHPQQHTHGVHVLKHRPGARVVVHQEVGQADEAFRDVPEGAVVVLRRNHRHSKVHKKAGSIEACSISKKHKKERSNSSSEEEKIAMCSISEWRKRIGRAGADASDSETSGSESETSAGGDSSLDPKSHSNFLELLKMAQGEASPELYNVGLVLALTNRIFDDENRNRVLAAIADNKTTATNFVRSYAIGGSWTAELEPLLKSSGRIVLRSKNGIEYPLENGRLVPHPDWAEFVASSGQDLQLRAIGSVVPGFSRITRFASMSTLHKFFRAKQTSA